MIENKNQRGRANCTDASPPSWRQRLFQPARPWCIPYRRAWSIGLRTLHLMATSILVGGYAFGAAAGHLKPLLYVATVTGVGLIVLEAYPTLHFIFEGWGLFLIGKLVLLWLMPLVPSYRLPVILAVVAVASIGSHLPARFRHYSLLYRKVMKP